jgi:hypothetical protein
MTRLLRLVGVPLTMLLVVSMLGAGTSFIAAPRAAAASALAADPTLAVTPAVIAQGGQITVSGTGFTPNGVVKVLISGQSSPIAMAPASANGTVGPLKVTIPPTTAVGIHAVTLVGPHLSASVTPLSVTAAAAPTPAVTVRPVTLAPGGQITISGTGFGANEVVAVLISPQANPVLDLKADANGAVPATAVRIPASLALGVHMLILSGNGTHRAVSTQIALSGPMVTLTATRLALGGQLIVSGAGFGPNEMVAMLISPQANPVLDLKADANGAVPATTVTVPATFAPGAHTLTLSGSSTHRSVSTQITLTPPSQVTLAATPATTNRGGLVTVSGSNFVANEAINVTISGLSMPLATVNATAQGTLPVTGISIPYSVSVGTHTLTATGANSKRSATAAVTVAPLTPSLNLSAPNAAPGTTETVTGKGFGSKEQITLSLNGEALATAPAVITTTNGAFTAMFKMPRSILRGINTISAIGNVSRVSAAMQFNGLLTRTAQFYFAGGLTTTRDHAFIELLNTNAQPASVRLTFYFNSGAAYTRLVEVGAHAAKRVAVANLGVLPEGWYGLVVKADRQIAAAISTMRDGQDGDVELGATGLATHWYLAKGSTRGSFQERVSILNPSFTLPVHVQLQLVTPTRVKTVVVTAPAHTNKVVDVNRLLPGAAVSVIAIADRPVVVARSEFFGPGGRGLTMRIGAHQPATTWLFSDATTQNGVRTTFSILNPGDYAARVTASFSQGNGVVLGSRTVSVAPRSRFILNLGDVVHGGGIGASLTSDQAVVVERAEYIGAPDNALAASVVVGRNGAAMRWTFPGGTTVPDNDEVLDLFNPSAVTVPITATFYGSDGRMVTRQYTLQPTQRLIIPVNTLGLTVFHGAVLQSANGQGFIAERGLSTLDSHLLLSTQGLAQ